MSIEDAPTEESKFSLEFKVVLVGESNVGKTTLLYRYTLGEMKNGLLSTVGLDFRSKIIDVAGVPIKLQIWDTAGQERFRTLSKQLLRGAKGIVLVFDLTQERSFHQLNYWINSFESFGIRDEQVIVIGNKSDLIDKRQVTEADARKTAVDHSFNYIETSAVTGEGVDLAFETLAKELQIKNGPFLPGRVKTSIRATKQSISLLGTIAEAPAAIGRKKDNEFRGIRYTEGKSKVKLYRSASYNYGYSPADYNLDKTVDFIIKPKISSKSLVEPLHATPVKNFSPQVVPYNYDLTDSSVFASPLPSPTIKLHSMNKKVSSKRRFLCCRKS